MYSESFPSRWPEPFCRNPCAHGDARESWLVAKTHGRGICVAQRERGWGWGVQPGAASALPRGLLLFRQHYGTLLDAGHTRYRDCNYCQQAFF